MNREEAIVHGMEVADHGCQIVGNRFLLDILPGGSKRQAQFEDYERMAAILGAPGAPCHAAR